LFVLKKALISGALGASLIASGSLVQALPQAHAGTKAAARNYKIVLIAGIASDAFYITMSHGALAEAKTEGASLQYSGSSVSFSPSTQLPYLNAAIAQKPDLILIAPTDKVALQAPIQRAVSAGTPVLLVDTTLTNPSLAITTISSDNIAGGKDVADALAKAIGKKGKVAVVNTSPGVSTTDQRVQGFDQELGKYPHVSNLGVTFTGDDSTRANSVVKSLVAAHPDLAGVFATNVLTGEGVTSAEPAQVQAVKSGTIAALVAQNPYGIGQLAVRYGLQYLNGNHHLAKHYGTGEVIITKANVNSASVANYLYSK